MLCKITQNFYIGKIFVEKLFEFMKCFLDLFKNTYWCVTLQFLSPYISTKFQYEWHHKNVGDK